MQGTQFIHMLNYNLPRQLLLSSNTTIPRRSFLHSSTYITHKYKGNRFSNVLNKNPKQYFYRTVHHDRKTTSVTKIITTTAFKKSKDSNKFKPNTKYFL